MKPTRRCDQCPYGGCDHPHAALGLCGTCYRRQQYRQRQGHLDTPLHEPLSNGSQRLTPDDYEAIRAWYAREQANGLRMRDIAEHYGVSKQRISQIVHGK